MYLILLWSAWDERGKVKGVEPVLQWEAIGSGGDQNRATEAERQRGTEPRAKQWKVQLSWLMLSCAAQLKSGFYTTLMRMQVHTLSSAIQEPLDNTTHSSYHNVQTLIHWIVAWCRMCNSFFRIFNSLLHLAFLSKIKLVFHQSSSLHNQLFVLDWTGQFD